MKKIQLYYMKFGGKYNTCGYGINWHLSNTLRLFLKQDIFILYAIEKLQRNSKKIIRHFFQACLCTYTKVTYLHVNKRTYQWNIIRIISYATSINKLTYEVTLHNLLDSAIKIR